MIPARILVGPLLALVTLAVSGCSSLLGCTDTTADRGRAGVRVRIEDNSGRLTGATAKIVDWRLEPYPQKPAAGDQVHFHFRFDGAKEFNGPELDACAVDTKRVVLGCQTVYSFQSFEPAGDRTSDEWIYAENPAQVAEVLLIPNNQSYDPRTCDQDGKDGGGDHPPKRPVKGDRL
ncbi:hypothetical protein [Streptomyces sp. NPDC093970]|uniref:hypothetical protein n=1 Tax=Streptomyces sp. NPDC093970 TaxID=3155076 RepID=UPI003428D80F